MASKFQNRLVGTIILVTFGVIVLPNLLDGKKKYYQDEYTTIPLVLQSGYSDEFEQTLLVGQKSSNRLPKGTGKMLEESNLSAGNGRILSPLHDAIRNDSG